MLKGSEYSVNCLVLGSKRLNGVPEAQTMPARINANGVFRGFVRAIVDGDVTFNVADALTIGRLYILVLGDFAGLRIDLAQAIVELLGEPDVAVRTGIGGVNGDTRCAAEGIP